MNIKRGSYKERKCKWCQRTDSQHFNNVDKTLCRECKKDTGKITRLTKDNKLKDSDPSVIRMKKLGYFSTPTNQEEEIISNHTHQNQEDSDVYYKVSGMDTDIEYLKR